MNVNDAANLINIISTLPANCVIKQQLISLITVAPSDQNQFVSHTPTKNKTICGNQINGSGYYQCDSIPTNQINKSDQLNSNNDYAISSNMNTHSSPIHNHCKLQMFHNKYGTSNHQSVNEYVSKCNLNNDYKHFKTFHSTNNDAIKVNQLLNEYTAIYDFLPNFNQSINSSLSVNEINFFNTKMDHIYNKLNKLNTGMVQKQMSNFCDNSHQKHHLKIRNITPSPTYHLIGINNPKEIEHGRKVKSDSNKFVCTKCGKKYKHSCNLKTHMKIHGDEALICPHCNKRFGRKANYTEHLRIHTGETPYECTYCFRKFKHHHSWKDHTRIHTGENPYKCVICGKRFKVGHNLTVHFRIHTGEKPYQCKICFKMFRQKSGLNSHVKRLHS